MSGKKKFATIIVMLAILLAVFAGLVWHMNHYRLIDMKFYPKDAQSLDLRGEDISAAHYDKLVRYMPDCEIIWDVPFQNSAYPSNTTNLTVTSLSEEDLDTLDYFSQLETLHAEGCADYAQLLTLMNRRPELKLYYNILIQGETYDQDTRQLEVETILEEELALLPGLKQLDTVIVSGGEDIRNIPALQEYCHENNVDFCVALGADSFAEDVQQISLEGITDEQLHLLRFLPNLKQVHMVKPLAAAENVIALQKNRLDLTVTWEQEVCGQLVSTETVEIDLSDTAIASVEEVEQVLAYFPNVERVFLGEQPGIDNETMAAYRERSRENYKVVWVVDLSGKMKVRTDIDNFMPSRDGWGYVREGEVDNIRYCEDLICIDLGHMGLKTVDFLEPLVNLEYLILAHTEVQYIDAISNCKKLRYLELDWSPIKDLSPLVACTALEDLNIGKTWPDITPVLQMTWLKNLYMIMGRPVDAWKASQALPDTRVVASGSATVASGWRNLPNYYKMRDILGMYYMN